MANIGFVDAFSKFGAKLDNPMWAVSAIAQDGALVISCWEHYFKKGESAEFTDVDSTKDFRYNPRKYVSP